MAFTIEGRKIKYNEMLARKGNELYLQWKMQRVSSKAILSLANDFLYGISLKNSNRQRLSALIFMSALDCRLQERYKSFLSKLFHFFVYRKEKKIMQMMKRIFGYQAGVLFRELLAIECEKIAIIVEQKFLKDGKRGGLRLDSPDITFEELSALLEEETEIEQEEMRKGEEKQAQKETESGQKFTADNTLPVNLKRSNFTVKLDAVKQNNKTAKPEQSVKENIRQDKEKVFEDNTLKTDELPTKAIYAGIAEIETLQNKEQPAPFPVFKIDEKALSDTKQDNKEKIENEHVESAEQEQKIALVEENERGDDDTVSKVFPVFREGKSSWAAVEREQTNEKQNIAEKQVKNIPVVKKEESISEENLFRRELNNTMSDEQRIALATQLQEEANLILQQEEAAWREKISVQVAQNNGNENEQALKQDGFVLEAPKLKK